MIMYPINFHHKINGGFQQGLHFRHFLFFFVCHLLFQVFLMFVCPLVFCFSCLYDDWTTTAGYFLLVGFDYIIFFPLIVCLSSFWNMFLSVLSIPFLIFFVSFTSIIYILFSSLCCCRSIFYFFLGKFSFWLSNAVCSSLSHTLYYLARIVGVFPVVLQCCHYSSLCRFFQQSFY